MENGPINDTLDALAFLSIKTIIFRYLSEVALQGDNGQVVIYILTGLVMGKGAGVLVCRDRWA